MPNIFLVSDVAPDPNGGGGSVYLDAVADECPSGSLSFGWVGQKEPESADSWQRFPYTFVATPDPKKVGAHLPNPLRRTYRIVFEWVVDVLLVPRMVRKLARFGRERAADLVWVTLSSPYPLRLAMPLARRLGVPLIVTIWDPPTYKLRRFGLRGRLLDRYLRVFDQTLRASACCAVMSAEMKRRYERLYGTPCVVLNHGPEEADWREPQPGPVCDHLLVIGFAGSLYARREFEALLNALAGVGWRWRGRDVVLRMLTAPVDLAEHSKHVEQLGWLDLSQTLDVLSSCDVCYLPYWMSEEYSEVVQLAFPTKLSLYLASGRPVFFHGPRESSPTHFLDEHPAGVVCHSLDPEQILASLAVLFGETGRYSEATQAGRRALLGALGRDVFRRHVAQILKKGAT